MRILVTDGMDKDALQTLKNNGHEVVEQFYAPEELGAALKEFDAVVVRSATKVRANHIDEAKGGKLKLIIRGGVGVDNIDVKYAEAAGITVKNTPRASSQSVAELAMAHMFACARFVSIAGHTMREDKWEKKAYGKGIELQGKTLGIVGFGRIGQHLGVMAKAIGMNVIAEDIFHIPGIEEKLGIPYVELDELLAKSDFISVHAPAVDGGALINAETIAKMKDGVTIINTSRGTNVDEAALLAGLESGKVRSAGLDVYADEPATNKALYSHPMVSCTPHIGAATKEAQKRIGAEIVEIIESEIPGAKVAVLSGPSHAEEVGIGIPTTVVAGARDMDTAKLIQNTFMNDVFRVYTSTDVTGIELGGSVKNVIALAAGITDGLGFGDNTKAALMTRGMAEILRLGTAMGAHVETLAGLSGMGDLIVTCASVHSRNRKAGYLMGQGKSMQEAMDEVQMVVEGVYSAKAAVKLGEKYGVSLPIINKVSEVLFDGKDPKEAVNELMLRDNKAEHTALPWEK